MTFTRTPRAGLGLSIAIVFAALAGGCAATGHPGPIRERELAEAQTFPYYRTYWAGPRFEGRPLVAADGRKGYNSEVGDSVYYGDCVSGKGVFGGGGSCTLPLQITTVIYRLHSNQPLGPQRNTLIRGVPATVYDEGRSIELYSDRVAIDIFSNSFPRAYAAALALRPLNASGSASSPLPSPVYCPGLSGPPGALGAPCDGDPARTPLPAGRGAAGVHEQPAPECGGAAGARGRLSSPRMLRNAAEPISAGTHNEIAR